MRSWVKRLLLIASALLVIIAAVVFLSLRLLRGTPEWYHRSTATYAEKDAAARRALNKFAGVENAAATYRADPHHATSQNSRSPQPITVSFSDDELNAFFEKWANFENWKQNYDRVVDDPIIILQNAQIVLAGRVKDLDTIVSLQFDPSLDADGKIDLHLTQILGGRLPLPEAFAGPWFRKITDSLRSHLPAWRSGAAVQSDGAANKELIYASLARLLIRTLQHQSTDPILFLPVIDRHANVPVRIVATDVKEHLLTVTVIPLDAAERASLLKRIQTDDPAIDPPAINPPGSDTSEKLAAGR